MFQTEYRLVCKLCVWITCVDWVRLFLTLSGALSVCRCGFYRRWKCVKTDSVWRTWYTLFVLTKKKHEKFRIFLRWISFHWKDLLLIRIQDYPNIIFKIQVSWYYKNTLWLLDSRRRRCRCIAIIPPTNHPSHEAARFVECLFCVKMKLI